MSYSCSSMKRRLGASPSHQQKETNLDCSHCGGSWELNSSPLFALRSVRCCVPRSRAEPWEQTCDANGQGRDNDPCLSFQVVCGGIIDTFLIGHPHPLHQACHRNPPTDEGSYGSLSRVDDLTSIVFTTRESSFSSPVRSNPNSSAQGWASTSCQQSAMLSTKEWHGSQLTLPLKSYHHLDLSFDCWAPTSSLSVYFYPTLQTSTQKICLFLKATVFEKAEWVKRWMPMLNDLYSPGRF